MDKSSVHPPVRYDIASEKRGLFCIRFTRKAVESFSSYKSGAVINSRYGRIVLVTSRNNECEWKLFQPIKSERVYKQNELSDYKLLHLAVRRGLTPIISLDIVNMQMTANKQYITDDIISKYQELSFDIPKNGCIFGC